MSAWPPSPDLDSIKELVRDADDDAELALRRPALEGLAQQIARFFGPEAQPQVRGSGL